jgi:RNA-directed DNA polymerase
MDSLSLSAAFQSVKVNDGCAGVDGITIREFESNLNANLFSLCDELERKTYFPLPLMQILVAKKNGEPRKLCIPAVRDRVVQRAVLDRIGPDLEKKFETCSYAYRKGRSVKQVIYQITRYYNEGYRWVVDADIDAFFDTVSHDILHDKMSRLIESPMICSLLSKWVKAEVWDGKHLTALSQGIPQGSAVSPVLANLFLDELDEAMLAAGYKYLRYADDYLVLCKNREEAFHALEFSKEVLENMALRLDDEAVTSFDQGFKYLGVVFLRSMVMKPFETQMKERKIINYPDPFNLEAYLLKRQRGW